MQKKIPMRQCVGCREMKPKKELIRVVQSPQGELSLAYRQFDLATDPELVESCVFQISAAKARCNYLIRAIKARCPDAAPLAQEDAAWI